MRSSLLFKLIGAFGLVVMAGIPLTFATGLVAFGNQIEARVTAELGGDLGPYVLIVWTGLRWLIAILTSIAAPAGPGPIPPPPESRQFLPAPLPGDRILKAKAVCRLCAASSSATGTGSCCSFRAKSKKPGESWQRR